MIHSHRTFSHLVHPIGEESFDDDLLRHAAWAARCVGRGAAAPLRPDDLPTLADRIQPKTLPGGSLMFSAGEPPEGVWLVQQGQVQLFVGAGKQRAVVDTLGPGDVDGDIALLLEQPSAYTARTVTESQCLFLPAADFEALLVSNPAIARRWLSSVTRRVCAVQARLISTVGHPLPTQVSHLLLDEAVDGSIPQTQRVLAAMLGVQRSSLHKIVEEFERRGLVTIDDDAVAVADPDRLRRLCPEQ